MRRKPFETWACNIRTATSFWLPALPQGAVWSVGFDSYSIRLVWKTYMVLLCQMFVQKQRPGESGDNTEQISSLMFSSPDALWAPCSSMCVVPSLPHPARGLAEMGAHCRTKGLTDHINPSAPVKAATYQCTIISCPQQMPQHQSWAIIWFSFCPKYPSGWFFSSVNIVLGPQLCNQSRWNETTVLQFALSLREYQTLSILLKSINFFSRLLYFPYTGMILFFSNQKSPKPTGVSVCVMAS